MTTAKEELLTADIELRRAVEKRTGGGSRRQGSPGEDRRG